MQPFLRALHFSEYRSCGAYAPMGRLIAACVALWLLGCECGAPHDPLGPCASTNPPPACGQSCTDFNPCPTSFYCVRGVCTQDCDPLRPDVHCPGGECSDDGHCTGRMSFGTDAAAMCPDARVGLSPVEPNVVLIVDQSASMVAEFGTSNRWDALRDSLLRRPDGFVAALEESVRFGLALYSAEAPGDIGDPVIGMCPLLAWVPPALSNYDAIESIYAPATPIDETPTGASIDGVISRLGMVPDLSSDPVIFVLATDGEPDTCEKPNPQEGQPEALAAVQRAFSMGIRTYIISVGNEVTRTHLQAMANAGLGVTSGQPNAPFWVAGNDEGLRDALGTIISSQISCTVTLEGTIQDLDQSCRGRIVLNGNELPCNDENGWRVLDASHIELQGAACEALRANPGSVFDATFPCDVVLI